MENELKLEKERILKELRETEQVKKETLEKETEYIKLILGLDLIKKFFIDVDKDGLELNHSQLLNSNEYKIFISRNFFLSDEPEKKINSNTKLNNILSKTEKDFYKNKNTSPRRTVKHLQGNTPTGRTTDLLNSTGTNNFKTWKNNSTKIYLKDIKEKYISLDVDYKTLIGIYSKMVYKTSFYHTNMINLNMRIINLEGKRDMYTKQVKEIISHNYKNFNDLVKNNSRFEHFMIAYKEEIQLKKENQLGVMFKNDLGNILDDDSNFFDYKSQYEKYFAFMSMIKRFLEIINTQFKIIHRENTVIKEERNLKTFFKLTHKMKLEMRAVRSKLDEVLNKFDNFLVGIDFVEPVVSIGGDNNQLLNVNNVKSNFLRGSTNTEVNKGQNFAADGLSRLPNALNIERISNTASDSCRQNDHRRSTYNQVKNITENNNLNSNGTLEEYPSIYNSKDQYIENIFFFYEKDDPKIIELKKKVEKISKINLTKVRNLFFSSHIAKQNFFDINIQLENTLYYFFSNLESISNLFIVVNDTEKFLKEIINSSIDSRQPGNEIDNEEEFSEKIILPVKNEQSNHGINEENLYEVEAEKEKEYEENLIPKNRDDQTTASFKSRRITSVKSIQITARDKDPFARTHIGFGQDINQKIINKLYKPFISQKDYNKNLNKNISEIKKDTRNSAVLNHYLKKKKKDIDDIAKDLVIYDNPSKKMC